MATPLKLVPDLATEVVNFGGGRGKKEIDFVFKSERKIPNSVLPTQLAFDIPRRWRRTDSTLETVLFPKARYTEPVIKQNRHLITFTACIDSADLPAGSFIGTMTLSGPNGLEPATVNVAVNMRDGGRFRLGLTVALLAALGLMVFQRARELKEEAKQANTELRWVPALGRTFNFGFVVESLIGLTTGALAAGGVYAQDVAWGDDTFPSLVSLAGTTLAAAGVQSFIATARGKTQTTENQNPAGGAPAGGTPGGGQPVGRGGQPVGGAPAGDQALGGAAGTGAQPGSAPRAPRGPAPASEGARGTGVPLGGESLGGIPPGGAPLGGRPPEEGAGPVPAG